jgi:hypothetical protein
MAARRIAARALPALSLWGLALWLTAAGCELIVDGNLPSIHCADEGHRGPPACPEGQVCTSMVCVEPARPAGSLGARCKLDGDCAPGTLCLDPSAFAGDGAFARGDPRCSRPCCTSSECGDAATRTVCVRPTLGGSGFCRDAVELGMKEPGARAPGEACGGDGECRSGRCDGATSPPSCLDTCCADTSCGVGGACRLGTRGGRTGFHCSSNLHGKMYGAPCAAGDDCLSGLCLPLHGSTRCSAPCCASSQCPDLDGDVVACTEVVAEGAFVRACAVVLPPTAEAGIGKPCAFDTDCRDGVCAAPSPGAARQCTGACCSDDGCGDPFRCRPVLAGPPWPLRCERK